MKLLITLPIYNEEKILEQSVRALYDFRSARLKDEFLINLVFSTQAEKS